MGAQIVRNPRAAAEQEPEVPLHADGSRYPFRMVYDRGERIGYADTPVDLMDLLIPGYAALNEQDQAVARIRHAVRVQVALQAEINANVDPEEWAALSDVERKVLNGPRFEQPIGWSEDAEFGDVWESEIPLILVETGYEPWLARPKPVSGIADVINPPNIVWLRPQDEWEFLQSLSLAGDIVLQESTDL